jgi:hypothetical protein
MKKLFAIFILLFCFSVPLKAVDMLDVDYNFIDTAFDGIQPITDKQFDDTVNKLTPQPVENTFGGKLKTFLFGRKYGVEPQPKGQDKEMDIGGEHKAIQDLKNGVQYIKLIASIVGENGQVIPLGNYKIQEKIINNQSMLVFYQGHGEYGMLKLKKFEDNLKKENELIYSRVDIISEDIIRIVYATLSDTKCAIAKVY